MESVENAPVDPVIEVDRWKNRRRMCWLTLVAALLFPVLILVTNSSQLGVIAGPFYIFAGLIVTAYIGGAVIDDKWSNSSPRNNKWDNDNVRH